MRDRKHLRNAQVYMTPELYAAATVVATREDRSVPSLLRWLLKRYLAETGEPAVENEEDA